MTDAAAPAAPPTSRAELAATLRLAAPLVGANLLQMAVYAVDVVFVVRLGTVELAAATLGVYAYSVILFALSGLVGAVAPIIAAERGARSHAVREVRRSFRMALWIAVLGSVPFMALLAHGDALLLTTGQDATVAARADAFLDILLWAMIPALVGTVMRITASALGRPGWAMVITALGLAVSILANWLLVFGNAGFPTLGLEGSAIASLVTATAMMFAYAVVLVADRRLRRFRLFGRWWRIEAGRLREIAVLGLPIAATMTFEGALFSAAGFLMGRIGVTEVAAHAIALQIAAFLFQVPFGIAQAATIRVGLAYGAGDRTWIARAGWSALIVGTGFMGFTALLLWAFPRAFLSVYVDVDAPANAAMIALALPYLAIAALFQLADGAQAVAAGVLRGVQDTRVPMVIALIGYWLVGFATSVALGFWTPLAGIGVWIGLALGLFVVAVLLVHRWHRREALGLVRTV
ncbi:MATE family efflux transporter [Sphingomonas sp. Leaf25]|uniref:MATE family efflux transporter n=1 Tax=Sphingomonas sp. Leaf25 TaxID=1735692 RepID=UPI000701CE1E|nr:MATE family efflux transporter [Sphingomonas sp. Leaf25]KQN00287.1 MATE family efflux transporter [Sphingomonas sp. Leaf25]